MTTKKDYLDNFIIPIDPRWDYRYDYRTPGKYLPPYPAGRVGFTCALYFRGGHLPEVWKNACQCVREYAQLIGEKAKIASKFDGDFVRAESKKLPLLDEDWIARKREEGYEAVRYVIGSSYREEYPPSFSLEICLRLEEWEIPNAPPLDKQISYIIAGFPPSFFLLKEPTPSFRDLVYQWASLLRPVHGTAGWGVLRSLDALFAEAIKNSIAPYLLLSPGLDLPGTFYTWDMVDTIANINWLTLINDELAERVGGPSGLAALGKDCPVFAYPGGYMIQAGPAPEIGATDKGIFLPEYRKVQSLLMPLYPEQLDKIHIVDAVLPPDAPHDFKNSDYMNDPNKQKYVDDFKRKWLHRFE